MALLGVAFALKHAGTDPRWLNALLMRSITELNADPWQSGLAHAASSCLGASTAAEQGARFFEHLVFD